MTYAQTLDWMFSQLPMYQKVGSSAYEKDLTNTIAFTKHLNHPEVKFKSIHIGGTNGKGSTSSMIASVLQEAGYKVGLYTSPHLKDYRERIKINGEMISEEYVVSFIEENKPFLENHHLSFFEMTVGLAFQYFADQKVDVALIEVGLGGRLDSTNIITPLASVITNIGFDHMAILGNTLEEIAFEKAGIIKTNVPVIIGQYTEETKPVFIKKAEEVNATIWFAQDIHQLPEYASDLKGNYQVHNKRTVVTALNVLKQHFVIHQEHIQKGLMNVVKNTGLLGRWQVLGQSPLIVADTAHNKHGLDEVLPQIQEQSYSTLHFVLGVVNDKDLDQMLPLLPKQAVYYIAKPDVPRGLEVEMLAQKMQEFGFEHSSYSSVPEAFEAAKFKATAQDMIYVGGSTFVVAEIV